MDKFAIYAVTHEHSGLVYIGVCRLMGDGVFSAPLGDAIILFHTALPKLAAHDNFTIKLMDTEADFFSAAELAQTLIVRLKEHMPGKVINPIDGETRAAVDTGIKLSENTMRAKALLAKIPYTTMYQRLKRGWTERQALGLDPPPPRTSGGKAKRMVVIDGVERAYSVWCRLTGISIETALARENRLGWTVKRAVTTPAKNKHKKEPGA